MGWRLGGVWHGGVGGVGGGKHEKNGEMIQVLVGRLLGGFIVKVIKGKFTLTLTPSDILLCVSQCRRRCGGGVVGGGGDVQVDESVSG